MRRSTRRLLSLVVPIVVAGAVLYATGAVAPVFRAKVSSKCPEAAP